MGKMFANHLFHEVVTTVGTTKRDLKIRQKGGCFTKKVLDSHLVFVQLFRWTSG